MGKDSPLLLRTALGEKVERPPVWMMRQAGRYMKIYRDLRDKHPSFRERSENPELSYEISMQPFHAFKPCLLYTSPSPRDRVRSRMPSSA